MTVLAVPRMVPKLCLTLCLLSSGCFTLGTWSSKPTPPAPLDACQIHSLWENKVVTTADSVNQGNPLPGLAGRVYLFGPQVGHPVTGTGQLTVDLFDAVHLGPDGQPKWLERYNFDQDTLKLLLRRDRIGWGYTLFLPWPAYRADITRVQLKVSYLSEKNAPLFAPPTTVTLRQEGGPILRNDQVVTQK